MRLIEEVTTGLFNFLNTIVGTLILLALLFFIVLRLRREQNIDVETKTPMNVLFILSISLVLIIIVLYYPIEAFLFNNFTFGTSSIDVYYNATNVLIGSVGIIVTAIFSYLIYIATKRGLKIADEAKEISNKQATISDNQSAIAKDQTRLIEKQLDLEKLKYKDERTRKFNELDKVPEIRLLMSIDYLLYEFSKLERKSLFLEIEKEIKEEVKKEVFNKFGDKYETMNDIENSTFMEKEIKENIEKHSGEFSIALTESFSNIMRHVEGSRDNFLLILYMSRIKRVTFNEEYILKFITKQKYWGEIRKQQLVALFNPPPNIVEVIIEELLKKLLNDIFDDVFKDILLGDLVDRLQEDRKLIVNKFKLELDDIFEGLINEEVIKILDEPNNAYEKLWKFY